MSKKALLHTKIYKIDKLNVSTYNPRIDLQPGDEKYEQLKKSIEQISYKQAMQFCEKDKEKIKAFLGEDLV